MAAGYRSTLEVSCWKHHTCVNCGGALSYLFQRKVTGQGRNAEAATKAAQANAVKAMTRQVDAQPCPTCGLFQPDMIGARRARWHIGLFWISAIAFTALMVLHLADLVRDDWILWITACFTCIAGAAGLLVDLRNPNRNLDSNRELAQQRTARGTLRQDAPGQILLTGVAAWAPKASLGYAAALVMTVIAICALGLPEIAREAAGWPFNPQWYPAVAGPGDETYLYLPHRVPGIKGYWSGTPLVTAREQGGAGPAFSVRASSRSREWQDTIHAKSDEKRGNSQLWVRLHLPDDTQYAGKTMECQIRLNVVYPEIKADKQFVEVSGSFSHTAVLQLADPRAGSRYHGWWWAGFGAGGGLLLISSFVRLRTARGLQRQALPARVSADGEPPPAEQQASGAN